MRDIGLYLNRPPILFDNNISALYLTINPVIHAQTKHVEIDYHFVCEKVAIGALVMWFVSSTDQLVDIFAKPLPKDVFHNLRDKLKVGPPFSLMGGVKGNGSGSGHGHMFNKPLEKTIEEAQLNINPSPKRMIFFATYQPMLSM